MVKKQFIKEKKQKASKAPQTPQTADEYLAAGVDFEEAGEKWRGGDAAKSTRFFVRAIELYDVALGRFPTSFDLAYNKARVQYEITQYPRLVSQLSSPLLQLLTTALESSRFALSLKHDNADVLFNTAQVLTSLVEAGSQDRSSELTKDESKELLEEAVQLFERCFAVQQTQYKNSFDMAASEPQGTDYDTSNVDENGGGNAGELNATMEATLQSQMEMEDRWALAVEPVSKETLLDTLLAMLETLTTLCSLIATDPGKSFTWLESYSTTLIHDRLLGLAQETDRVSEAVLAQAKFMAALADASYRHETIDLATYQQALEEAFNKVDVRDSSEGLCARAEALFALDQALRTSNPDATGKPETMIKRWKTLTAALADLTAASKLPSADNIAKIHLSRGDIELIRYQLGQKPWGYDPALKNGDILLKNANTFYKGAESHARALEQRKEALEASLKISIISGLNGDQQDMLSLIAKHQSDCRILLEEAVDEGLVDYQWLYQMGIS